MGDSHLLHMGDGVGTEVEFFKALPYRSQYSIEQTHPLCHEHHFSKIKHFDQSFHDPPRGSLFEFQTGSNVLLF